MSSPDPEPKRQKVDKSPAAVEDDKTSVLNQPKASVQELMRAYYSQLFPYQHMFKWLVYGNDGKHIQADAGFFQRREFAFTLDGDRFVRYNSFKDGEELFHALKHKCPSKIDIGPVYTCNPQERVKFGASFAPVERELVFDIDLTDYDDVRTCGSGGHICHRCWPLMAVAIQVIDAGLREEFGFQHIFWAYSGRRGVHCWVCDTSARKLTDEQRAAVAGWFGLYKGHEEGRIKLALSGASRLHPAVKDAYDLLESAFEEHILPQQRLLETDAQCVDILKFLPEEATGLADAVKRRWSDRGFNTLNEDLSVARWRALKSEVNDRVESSSKNFNLRKALSKCLHEIVFAHAYPRLDMEVSKKMNHLLKAPFCVHPKTGKVCVPIDPAHASEFDPDAVPTVHQLLEELQQAPDMSARPSERWQLTSLGQHIQWFQSSFLDPLLASNRAELAGKARVVAAITQTGMGW